MFVVSLTLSSYAQIDVSKIKKQMDQWNREESIRKPQNDSQGGQPVQKPSPQQARKASEGYSDEVLSQGSQPAGSSFLDNRDGKTYRTIQIGERIWMAENLSFAAEDGVVWNYHNQSRLNDYGLLYDWHTALTVCPAGWHLPGQDEWIELIDIAGEPALHRLKAESGWRYGNGTDNLGFSALPGGYYNGYEGYKYVNDGGYWWSASEASPSEAIIFDMGSTSPGIYNYAWVKTAGLSVRCVKD